MHLLTLLIASCLAVSFATAAEKKVVCYYKNWSVYREGKGQFNITDIDTSLCTHFIYSFLLLKGNDIVPSNPQADLPDEDGRDGYRLFTGLREKNPSAKFLVTLGGSKDSRDPKYSTMVSNRESREQFIENVVAFLKKHKFDGFDIDWEYPTLNGGRPTDRANFGVLLRELRERFDREGFLLTVSAAGLQWYASRAYDIPVISKYVDFVNLMTYDFHGKWEFRTGHHAAFRGEMSVESCVKYWLSQGLPKEKLVLGVPAYGRGWILSNPKNNAVGDYASGGSRSGPYTKEVSLLAYSEICEMIGEGDWSLNFDEQAQAPYAFKDDQWISYENVKSATAKAEFIKKSGLGGAMIWSIDFDDFRGTCGDKYPILRSLNAVLRNGEPVEEEEITSAPTENYEPEDNSETDVEEITLAPTENPKPEDRSETDVEEITSAPTVNYEPKDNSETDVEEQITSAPTENSKPEDSSETDVEEITSAPTENSKPENSSETDVEEITLAPTDNDKPEDKSETNVEEITLAPTENSKPEDNSETDVEEITSAPTENYEPEDRWDSGTNVEEEITSVSTDNSKPEDNSETGEEEIKSASTDNYESDDSSETNLFGAPLNDEDKGTGECRQVGNIADPDSCNYIACVPHYRGTFIRYKMLCPPTLCYNPANGICDWPKKNNYNYWITH